MIPSELLRKELSIKYNVNLEQYAWNEDLKNQIFSIKLDEDLESQASTLGEIFIQGFNIGHCGLTSRYVAREFDEAKLFYGKANLLKGTNSAPNGEHAWTTIDDYLIDTTLMIYVPVHLAPELGYITEKQLAYDSARMLPEHDVYDLEFQRKFKK